MKVFSIVLAIALFGAVASAGPVPAPVSLLARKDCYGECIASGRPSDGCQKLCHTPGPPPGVGH
ncbi:hypothetical protein OC835_000149 [Tilletia horrida]|nr:hypothetical protein OC835_000149 [Tilletia horrida]KAK0561047.1 hypothetical protein OC844_003421 [Tilletia horrida]